MKAHIKTLLMLRADIFRIAHSEGQQGEDLGCFLSKLVLKTTPAKISVVYGKSKCRATRKIRHKSGTKTISQKKGLRHSP